MAHAKAPTLRPHDDFEVAMAALIAPRWERVWDEIDKLRHGHDPDVVHDIRVASRRLRAAMDVAAPCFPAAWYPPLHRLARDITGALGGVRDRDVILEALTAEREAAPPEDRAALDSLTARVERERTRAIRAMWEFLAVVESSAARQETRRRFGGAGQKGGGR